LDRRGGKELKPSLMSPLQIEEFVDFHSRLDRSINKQILTLEKLRVSLSSKEFDQSKLEEMKKIVKKVDEDLKKGESFDQRDFTVIPSYQPVDERVKSIDELTSMGKKTGVSETVQKIQRSG